MGWVVVNAMKLMKAPTTEMQMDPSAAAKKCPQLEQRVR
jgi:hypothetical protein